MSDTFADIARRIGDGIPSGSGPSLNSSNHRVGSTFAQVAMDVGQGASKGQLGAVVNIVEFCEAKWGLGMNLMPVQRVILKAHYGIPLDDEKTFELRDWRGQKMRTFTEKSYLRMLYDDKRCNIPEVIPGEERRELVLSVGRRSGKCIRNDSLILTDRGIFRIDELGNPKGPEVQPLDIGVAQEGSVKSRSKYFYNGGVKPTRTFTTHCGYLLGGTDNHRIKVMTEDGTVQWRYLADLRIGDCVALHRNTDLWVSQYLKIGSRNLDEECGRLIGEFVGGKPENTQMIEDPELGSFIRGLSDAGVPRAILQSPRSVVCSFFRGLFDVCGSFKDQRFELTSCNKQLFRDAQTILLNMGVVSRVSLNPEGLFVLEIWGTDSSAIFDEALNLGLWDPFTEPEFIGYPHQGSWLRKLGSDPSVLEHFKHLMDLDYFYDPIVSIEEGENPVYDLNVPDGESFVANGMTNHNTFLAAAITAYETYKLLMKECPQEYYGLIATNTIQIVSVATDRDQAGLLYREANGHFRSCGFFLPYAANSTQTGARFQTPRDIDKFGRYSDDPTAKATLNITFKSCIAKSLRGAGNIVVILDEMAHFTDNGQSSAEEVYKAITPSKSTFARKDPITRMPVRGPDGEDGVVESRVIAISSPLGKQGQFYKLFQQAMKGGRPSKGMLAIQAPTWEVNPTIPISELETEYFKDPQVFFVEYGGEFSDRTRGWIERAVDLEACIHPNHRPITQAPARRPHFVGLDFGFVNDYTAVAIGHHDMLDGEKVIVLDYIDRIKAGEGKFMEKERLEFDDAIDWVYDLSRRFYFQEGLGDQFYGIAITDTIAKKGLRQIKCQKFSKAESSEIYQNFKGMMWDQRLVLYDWPLPNEPGKAHCPYIAELLELQAEEHSKYVIEVHKPPMPDKFDDMSDALVRMVWLASQGIGSAKRVSGSYGSASPQAPVSSMESMQRKALLRAHRPGSDPARMPARYHPGGRYTAGRRG